MQAQLSLAALTEERRGTNRCRWFLRVDVVRNSNPRPSPVPGKEPLNSPSPEFSQPATLCESDRQLRSALVVRMLYSLFEWSSMKTLPGRPDELLSISTSVVDADHTPQGISKRAKQARRIWSNLDSLSRPADMSQRSSDYLSQTALSAHSQHFLPPPPAQTLVSSCTGVVSLLPLHLRHHLDTARPTLPAMSSGYVRVSSNQSLWYEVLPPLEASSSGATSPLSSPVKRTKPLPPTPGIIDASKPVLVVLPHFFCDTTSKMPQLRDPHLRRDFNIVALDLRSYGRSCHGQITPTYDLSVAAADIALAMEALQLPPAHFFAPGVASFQAVVNLALYFPELVLSMTFAGFSSLTAEPQLLSKFAYVWSEPCDQKGGGLTCVLNRVQRAGRFLVAP